MATRRVMVMKGFTYGLPQGGYNVAFEKACDLIETCAITTIFWDGDLLPYDDVVTGYPASASFTRLLPALQSKYAWLEFVYAKKKSHLAAYGPVTKNKFGEYEGPFPFLPVAAPRSSRTKRTTNCRRLGQRTPYTRALTWHSAMVRTSTWRWGWRGLAWLKSHGIESVVLLIVGLGDTVKRELGAVEFNPQSYPKGVSLEEACVVEVAR